MWIASSSFGNQDLAETVDRTQHTLEQQVCKRTRKSGCYFLLEIGIAMGNACPRFRLQQMVMRLRVDDYFDSLPEDLVVGTKPGQIPCSTFAPSGDGFPERPSTFLETSTRTVEPSRRPHATHNPHVNDRTLSSAA